MPTYHEDVLAAISYYESVRDGNTTNQRQILADTPQRMLMDGLLCLTGSLIQSVAARNGASEGEFIEVLRAQYTLADTLGRFA